MCGIAGFQGPWDGDMAGQMQEMLAHRGPDGSGTACFEEGLGVRTGLAHRRLAIIDLSDEGLQPMTAACTRCGCTGLDDLALTFNGEIYNFRELRQDLRARGHAFHSGTDSEVLLHLYAEEGPAMLERLNGIFAFAIRDGRERGRPAGVEQGDLFMARDQYGIKPLYFAELPQGYLFASEIKAMLPCPELPREVDHSALHQQLAYLWTPGPRTMMRAVRKLGSGEAQIVRRGRVARQWFYYDLPYGREHLAESEAQVAERVREAVATAVERQMVSDVPVGAFLSGGLDSSSVVAMMKQARPDVRHVTYCIQLGEGEDADGNPADLPYAEKVAAHLGIELRALRVGPEIIDNLERMLWLLDEPQADPAPINALLISEQARRDGFKVLLSGAGGDDIFSGYRRHLALRVERAWTRFPRPVRAALGAAVKRGPGSWSSATWARRMVKLVQHAHLDDDRRLIAYYWWSGEQMRRDLYSPQLAALTAGEDTAAPMLDSLARIPGERDPLNRMLYLDVKHFLTDHNLNYTDRMGMAAGVEVRVPLMDRDLVDLAARIPPRMKQKGTEVKAIFKKSMEPLLPRDVIYRPKTGFGVPLRQWLKHELRDKVEETLSPEALRSRGLFDPAAVRRLVDADRAGRVDGAYTILALMCVEIWCRLFIDAPVPQPAART